MPRVGSCELYTAADGWVAVDLYDAADFNFAPVELQTASGAWGVPYLRSPGSADTPIEVYTSANGWQGINATGWVYIGDFETGDLSQWYVSTDPSTGVTARAATIGDYGVALADEEEQSEYAQRIYSHPNEGMDSLPYYPQVGDEFEIFVRLVDSAADDGHHRIAFGVSDQNVSQHFGPITTPNSTDFDNWLAIDIQPAVNDLHIWRDVDGTRNQVQTANFNPAAGQTYRIRIDWCSTTTDEITAEVYEYDPSGDDSFVVSISNQHPNNTSSYRGVFLETEASADPSYFDAWRKYPES